MTAPEYLVETRRLAKSYGAAKAVQDVDFRLDRNEVVGLLGDNGAGKTTLIRMISGSEKPTGGQILLRGQPVDMKSPRGAMQAGIETIHEYNSTVGTMSVTENILINREILKGVSRQFRISEENRNAAAG